MKIELGLKFLLSTTTMIEMRMVLFLYVATVFVVRAVSSTTTTMIAATIVIAKLVLKKVH